MIKELEELLCYAFDGVFFIDNQYYGSIAFAIHKEDIAFVGNNMYNEYTTV